MRLNYLAYTFSLGMMYFSLVLFIPILVALIYNETNAILPFFISGVSALLLSLVLRKIVKGVSNIDSINDIKKSEGLCAVTFCWIFAGMFAAIPYLFFGFNPI